MDIATLGKGEVHPVGALVLESLIRERPDGRITILPPRHSIEPASSSSSVAVLSRCKLFGTFAFRRRITEGARHGAALSHTVRLDELLDDAVVEPAVLRGMLPRLKRFLEPFVASLSTDPGEREQASPLPAVGADGS